MHKLIQLYSSQLKNQAIKKVLGEQPSADGNLRPYEDEHCNKENSSSSYTNAENAVAKNLSSPAEMTPLVSPSTRQTSINRLHSLSLLIHNSLKVPSFCFFFLPILCSVWTLA